jgi:hypothetical protein
MPKPPELVNANSTTTLEARIRAAVYISTCKLRAQTTYLTRKCDVLGGYFNRARFKLPFDIDSVRRGDSAEEPIALGFTPAEAETNAEQKVGGTKSDFVIREVTAEEFRTLERYL